MAGSNVRKHSAWVSVPQAMSGSDYLKQVIAALLLCVSAQGAVDYARDVRPILSQHCFKCHGTDQQKGGLRLDGSERATAELKSGHRAIVPGKPAASELMRRVTSPDEEEVMP